MQVDQFGQDELTDRATRRAAARARILAAEVLDPAPPLAALVACVGIMACLCETLDVDPEWAFAQVLEAHEAGALALSKSETAEL